MSEDFHIKLDICTTELSTWAVNTSLFASLWSYSSCTVTVLRTKKEADFLFCLLYMTSDTWEKDIPTVSFWVWLPPLCLCLCMSCLFLPITWKYISLNYPPFLTTCVSPASHRMTVELNKTMYGLCHSMDTLPVLPGPGRW